MDTFFRDARYAARAFAHAPLFTSVAVLTLAVGIGANATVFSFVSALLLRPTPGVTDPSSLVSVFTSDYSSGPYGSTSYPDFEALQSDAVAFSALGAFRESPALVRIGDTVERVRVMSVSGELLPLVGIRATTGRLLTTDDTSSSSPPVVVIGYALWQRAFGRRPTALGDAIALNGISHTIVGVMPEGFEGLNLGGASDVFTPLRPDRAPNARGNRGLSIVGRLRSGVSLRETQTQLDAIAARLAAAYPETNRGTLGKPDRPRPMLALRHTRLHPAFRSEVGMVGGVLLAAVGMVLLIACANVAGLLLSRATARQREVAVRLALGATRRRLVRQMLTESALLATIGGAMGLLVALWTADALPSFFPAEQARMLDAHVDYRVIAFATAIALLSGMLMGLAPAFHGLRFGRVSALRGDHPDLSDGRFGSRSRRILVVAQIALATVLLIAAVLLTRSLYAALDADLGFGTRQAVLASIELPLDGSEDAMRVYYRNAVESVAAVPGVESVALARFVPVAGTERRGFRMEGYTPRAGEDTELYYNRVSPEYFATMRIQVIAGRSFSAVDSATARRVVVVNELLASRYFNGDAVGRHLRDSRGTDLEIIGVVRASRRLSLQDPPAPVVFYPLDQLPAQRLIVVARTARDPARLSDTIRRTLIEVDRDVAVFRTVTLEMHLEDAVATNRLTAALVGACGLMALLLAVVGVYGIGAFTVARRTREIGVRVAFGARPAQIFQLVIVEGGRIVAIGIVAGAVASFAATRLLTSMLYGVGTTDPLTFVAVPIVLGLVAVVASCVPAIRALRLNPVTALRQE